MTRAVQELLDSFDQLPESERREAAAEILRRVRGFAFDPISDDELILSAERLFLELDRREDANEQSGQEGLATKQPSSVYTAGQRTTWRAAERAKRVSRLTPSATSRAG